MSRTTCTCCGAPGARWVQFPMGHCLACDACRERDGGWLPGSGKPVSGAIPGTEGEATIGYEACFRRDGERVCRKPKDHDGECIYT